MADKKPMNAEFLAMKGENMYPEYDDFYEAHEIEKVEK